MYPSSMNTDSIFTVWFGTVLCHIGFRRRLLILIIGINAIQFVWFDLRLVSTTQQLRAISISIAVWLSLILLQGDQNRRRFQSDCEWHREHHASKETLLNGRSKTVWRDDSRRYWDQEKRIGAFLSLKVGNESVIYRGPIWRNFRETCSISCQKNYHRRHHRCYWQRMVGVGMLPLYA